jgi:septal ring factor EnvC (AmiA/AmiB activator)
MLTRICLVVAILAGLAVGTLNFVKVKKIIEDTRAERNKWHSQFDETDRKLTKANKDLKATTEALAQTKKDLDTTKKDLATSVAANDTLKKQIATLQDNLAKSDKDLTEANVQLALYRQAFPNPQQALSVSKDMKALSDRVAVIEDEKKVLQRQLTRVQARLNQYIDPNRPIELPATLIGKVLVADPKWDFVVLNVGEEQGAQEHGELLVNRDGRLVAKIKISSVQKDRSIANVLPGWKLGEVLEGDQVIPAYPSQS